MVSFPSHLKKLRSLLRFWLEKLNCGFFHSLHSRKSPTKQLFQSKFTYFYLWVCNSYFLYWNFDWKSCFVLFFLEWNEWKNPQFNFSSQNLSKECNFFKWDGKETKISYLLFHRIWKNLILLFTTERIMIFLKPTIKNILFVNYFLLHWNFHKKSWFSVFFREWNKRK